MTHDDTHDREQLWDLTQDIRFAMFTTRHSNGHLHSCPMTTQNSRSDGDHSLWFFMSAKSDTLADIALNAEVNVAYADPDKDAYVSVAGKARRIEDMARKRQFWSKLVQAWFPGGVDDPDLALVRVDISHADCWNVRDSKLTRLFKMARAAVTGDPPSLGDHTRVTP